MIGKTRIYRITSKFIQGNVTGGAEKAVKKNLLGTCSGDTKRPPRTNQNDNLPGRNGPSGQSSSLEAQMTTERSKRADLLDEGQVAITDYKMISSHMTKIRGVRVKLSLMEFVPQTGRTHQIRVHSTEQLGCSIVGDNRYGLTTIYNLSKIPGSDKGSICTANLLNYPMALNMRLPTKHFIRTMNKFPIRIKPPRPGF